MCVQTMPRYVECSIYLYQNRGLPAVYIPACLSKPIRSNAGKKISDEMRCMPISLLPRLRHLSADSSLRRLDDGKSARAHGHGAQ